MADRTRPAPGKVTLERSLDGTIEEVWDLWTTAEGIEAWWGPEGFAVTVRRLDLRPGGILDYVMAATAPDQVDFLKKAGMPLALEVEATFTEVDPPRRLAYKQLADFIPGVKPYEVAHVVQLDPAEGRVRLLLTIDAMHDEHWTDMALKGWESELGKLAEVLATRR